MKQIDQVRLNYKMGRFLPPSFKFSHIPIAEPPKKPPPPEERPPEPEPKEEPPAVESKEEAVVVVDEPETGKKSKRSSSGKKGKKKITRHKHVTHTKMYIQVKHFIFFHYKAKPQETFVLLWTALISFHKEGQQEIGK